MTTFTSQAWRSMSVEECLKHTDFLVEATHFEQILLWEKWHEKISWEQLNGNLIQVGQCDGRPVVFSLCWDALNGKRVGFYHSTSQVVDHRMIEDWLKKHYSGPTTDALNFHVCFPVVKG